jgi:hypothetical protein
MGHEDAFPRPRLSARCRFSQGTFAGTRATGEARRFRPFARPRWNRGSRPLGAIPCHASGSSGRQKADIHTNFLHMPITSSPQLVEQRLRLFQIGGVEALGEPAIDRVKKRAGSIFFSPVAPQARHASCETDFEQSRPLAAGQV